MQRKFRKNFQIILLASSVVYKILIKHDICLTVEIKYEHEGYKKSLQKIVRVFYPLYHK